MKEVLLQAEKLAQSILFSSIYTDMKKLERDFAKDEEATKLLSEVAEKRQIVENILASKEMDAEVLAKAAKELENAEEAMDKNTTIEALRNSRKKFSQMMANVNQMLRFVITGEINDDEGGCSGTCDGCSGCH